MQDTRNKLDEALELLGFASRILGDISPQFDKGTHLKDSIILADEDIRKAIELIDDARS